jgi:hypothetical protein
LKAAETFGMGLLADYIFVWPVLGWIMQHDGCDGSSNGQENEDAHGDEETSKA